MGARLSRKPDDVLRRIGAGGTTATVNRILRTWHRQTSADFEAGVRWYGEDAEHFLATLVRLGAPTREHAAAVTSQHSPRTPWARNKDAAVAHIVGGALAARELGAMGENTARAEIALRSDDPVATIRGPKTSAFARNLLGDREAVTVDVWAARVAFGETSEDPESDLGKVGVYDAVAHCYRLAARRIGVDPTTMQATTWIVARNGRAD